MLLVICGSVFPYSCLKKIAAWQLKMHTQQLQRTTFYRVSLTVHMDLCNSQLHNNTHLDDWIFEI